MVKFNFLKFYKINLFFAIIVSIFSIFYILYFKIDLGLEFTGGVEIELKYAAKVNIDEIRTLFKDIKNVQIKYYGSKKNLQIKIKKMSQNNVNILKNLVNSGGEVVKIDYIGPEFTSAIIQNSFIAIVLSIIIMLIYLLIRFNFYYSLVAVFVLLHDILITFFLINYSNLEFNLPVMAALFAVFGYSVNDTIIIFDRLRENLENYVKDNILNIFNMALNQTLNRTLGTSFSTLLVVVVIFIFGSEYLYGFSLTLFFGILVGTYSSMYIAPGMLLFLNKNNSK